MNIKLQQGERLIVDTGSAGVSIQIGPYDDTYIDIESFTSGQGFKAYYPKNGGGWVEMVPDKDV